MDNIKKKKIDILNDIQKLINKKFKNHFRQEIDFIGTDRREIDNNITIKDLRDLKDHHIFERLENKQIKISPKYDPTHGEMKEKLEFYKNSWISCVENFEKEFQKIRFYSTFHFYPANLISHKSLGKNYIFSTNIQFF
jgi:hypothetical protein